MSAPAKVKWEYLVHTYRPIKMSLEQTLNMLGAAGWELVQMEFDESMQLLLVFKRRL